MTEYKQFIQTKMTKQVNHVWNTYKNKAMNNSVAALASRNKTDSISASLTTLVSIAAGCQISNFATFWTSCCTTLGFQIECHLLSILQASNRIKRNKNARSGTTKSKIKRSTHKYAKYNNAFRKQHDGHQKELG